MPEPRRPGAGLGDRAPQGAQLGDGLGGGVAHARDQLDLARVELALDLAVHLAEPVHDGLGRVDLLPRLRVDEEQLLLDAERERLPLAELVRLRHPARLPTREGSDPFVQ